MQAGALRHVIDIEAPTESQNAYGEPVTTWAIAATVHAAREDLTGREAYLAQQVRATVTTRFLLRYREGLTAKMRVRSDGTAYNIASVADPDGRRRVIVLLTERES